MARHGGMTHGHRPAQANHHRKPPTVAGIMRQAAALFEVTYDDLTSRSRAHPLVYYRQVAMAACRELVPASYPVIARAFGRKDHTTVMHACEAVAEDAERQQLLRLLVARARHADEGGE